MPFIKLLFITLINLVLSESEVVFRQLDTTHISSISISGEVNERELSLHPNEGKVYYRDKPFTGFSLSFYDNGQLAQKAAYVGGKRQGTEQKWFDNGVLSFEASYESNKLHGTTKSWWANGNQRSKSNYVDGKVEGEQLQWYTSGNPFKSINIINGKEEGLQQAWRENGKLYANYEAKNGRIFGLKRANLCYELSEEDIQYAN